VIGFPSFTSSINENYLKIFSLVLN
jgi:hypothetical protein